MSNVNVIMHTSDRKIVLVPRLIAGLPLLGFGVLHFVKPSSHPQTGIVDQNFDITMRLS